jgi:Ca2+:H+ antiporter
MFPALAMLLFAVATGLGLGFTPSIGGLLFAVVLLSILFGTVFAAVHHAEVIAERIGEPYGTLLLTLAVTIIEVALIATIMLGDKPQPALARDTVFAVVMIVCNGLVGLCIFIGGLRYREQDFQVSGSNLYLSVLFVLATITLIMPNYTLTSPGPVYSAAQLGFVSVVTLILYAVFLYPRPSGIVNISSTRPKARRPANPDCPTECCCSASRYCLYPCWRWCCWPRNFRRPSIPSPR